MTTVVTRRWGKGRFLFWFLGMGLRIGDGEMIFCFFWAIKLGILILAMDGHVYDGMIMWNQGVERGG